MHSAALFLAYNSGLPNLDASGSSPSGFLVEPAKCNRSPMPGLDSPGLDHRIVEPCATGLPMPGHQHNATGRPMPGLDSPGL